MNQFCVPAYRGDGGSISINGWRGQQGFFVFIFVSLSTYSVRAMGPDTGTRDVCT